MSARSAATAPGAALRPGLKLIQGNRLEWLSEVVLDWLHRHPLDPLEEEVVLVQSNGMAEWLKMQWAQSHRVCAAARLELPARFLWRAMRAVLGRAAVPPASPLDKAALAWRLMRLLPDLAAQPVHAPLAAFLHAGAPAEGPMRRLQLAQRLADLLDQYQVYRPDWLADWAAGHDGLRPQPDAPPQPLDDTQRWQPALWRALLAELPAEERAAARPVLLQRFVAALAQAKPEARPPLPRRVVLFGSTHIPLTLLDALVAMSAHSQVLIALPNPCRYHWADAVGGRELLQQAARRQPLRGGLDLATLPPQALHAHGHPLLAAWGRQSRDLIRQIEAFEAQRATRGLPGLDPVDLFDDALPGHWLGQVQAHIRDLLPLPEHPRAPLPEGDRSIVFHVAHSPMREVEILHDQLLHMLAHPPGGAPLAPRDIVVMVPQVDTFAPAIRAVFGQYPRHDARHIPWGLADHPERGHQPLLIALEWLLRLPQQRCTAREIRELLDVPAVARRRGLHEDDLATLAAWIDGAGIRWGLHAGQRGGLGLGACGELNTWRFGLQRMLLGYATGALPSPAAVTDAGTEEGTEAAIEPYDEVAGLDAALAGPLAELLDTLGDWWAEAGRPRALPAWVARLRLLLQAFFRATDEADRAVLAALDDALAGLLRDADLAGFDEPVPLEVVREAWLQAVDEPQGTRRFRAGGVTFCTLLPLRAVPFEVVCLLGMNEADYPRRSPRRDFDLMALPGQARAGDRSRRDDDRQLMLDALLSARRVLYVSWCGRSLRDHEAQPPSVLVAQLRDYLAAGWSAQAVQQRTTEHPMQPFSRAYFAAPGMAEAPGLFTYAAEWRAAHEAAVAVAPQAAARPAEPGVWTLAELTALLRRPVSAYFQRRLQVRFDPVQPEAADDEPFTTDGLERWSVFDEVMSVVARQSTAWSAAEAGQALDEAVQAELARLRRSGRLPLGGPGQRVREALARTLSPMLRHWVRSREALGPLMPVQALHLAHPGVPGLALQDTLPPAWHAPWGEDGATSAWVAWSASKLQEPRSKAARPKPLLAAWIQLLACAAAGRPTRAVLIGPDAVADLPALDPAEARAVLLGLLRAAHAHLAAPSPWPVALHVGLAALRGVPDLDTVYETHDLGALADGRDVALARQYPSVADLRADARFGEACVAFYGAYALWLAQGVSLRTLEGARVEAGGDEDDGDD